MSKTTSKPTKAAPEATDRPPCDCGCGGSPKGAKSRYLPGHDARHVSAQKTAEKAGAS